MHATTIHPTSQPIELIARSEFPFLPNAKTSRANDDTPRKKSASVSWMMADPFSAFALLLLSLFVLRKGHSSFCENVS